MTVLLSTSLAGPAWAGCMWAELFLPTPHQLFCTTLHRFQSSFGPCRQLPSRVRESSQMIATAARRLLLPAAYVRVMQNIIFADDTGHLFRKGSAPRRLLLGLHRVRNHLANRMLLIPSTRPVKLFIGAKVLCVICFKIFIPEGRGGEKVGSANFKTNHTE